MLEPVMEEDESELEIHSTNGENDHDARRTSDVLVLQKGIKSISRAVQAYKQTLPSSAKTHDDSHDGTLPPLTFQNNTSTSRPPSHRRPSHPYRAAQPATLSLTTQHPTTALPCPSPPPPPPPPPPQPSSHLHLGKLSEQDLLATLQSIRKEEEARLHTRRQSFHIVDFGLLPPLPLFSPLRVPLSPTMTTTTASSSRRPPTSTVVISTTSTSGTTDTSAPTLLAPVTPSSPSSIPASRTNRDRDKNEGDQQSKQDNGGEAEKDGKAPYAECGTYQLVRAKERLRDLEHQLQDAVCCLQDYVQVIARRTRRRLAEEGATGQKQKQKQPQQGCESGEETAEDRTRGPAAAPVVDALQDKLVRLGRAHERLATEHALVTAEIKARAAPGMVWDGTMEALVRMARDGMETG